MNVGQQKAVVGHDKPSGSDNVVHRCDDLRPCQPSNVAFG